MGGQKITYFKFVQSASLFFALLVAFWIPSYRWILSDFIVAWVIFSILEFKFGQRFRLNLKGNLSLISFVLQLILFLLILSEVIFAGDKNVILKNVAQKLSLFIFPLLFALSGNQFKKRKDLFLKLFVLSNIIMSLICLGVAFYNSVSFSEGKFFFESYDTNSQSYFTNSNLSVFHHRSYFSMFIVFSVAILFWLNEKAAILNSHFKKVLFVFLILFFSLMIFLLESRAGIISLFFLFSLEIFLKVYQSKNTILKIITPVIILIMAVLVLENGRIQKTVNQVTNSEKSTKRILGTDAPARLVLWSAAFNLIEKNIWTGTGREKFQEKFTSEYEKYQNKGLSIHKKTNYNVHNQFLEEFVLYGLFGLMLLLSLFIYPIIYSLKRKNYLFLSFLLITGFNFLFESMFNTIAGIVFFSFFLNYFIFVFNDDKLKPAVKHGN